MGKSKDGQARGIYTLEFKMEAVRLVQGGQASSVCILIEAASTAGMNFKAP